VTGWRWCSGRTSSATGPTATGRAGWRATWPMRAWHPATGSRSWARTARMGRGRPPELHKLITEAGVSLVITATAQRGVLKETHDLGGGFSVADLDAVAGLRAGGPELFRIDREPDEPVALLFASGSTGLSKGRDLHQPHRCQ
jgi:hypothetical protein